MAFIIIGLFIFGVVVIKFFKNDLKEAVKDIANVTKTGKFKYDDILTSKTEDISKNFICLKCGHTKDICDLVHTPEEGFMAMLNFDNVNLLRNTCKNCGFTEMYNFNLLSEKQNYLEWVRLGELSLKKDQIDYRTRLKNNFKCRKCNNNDAIIILLAFTGTGYSRAWDIHGERYVSVICKECAFIEMYKGGF